MVNTLATLKKQLSWRKLKKIDLSIENPLLVINDLKGAQTVNDLKKTLEYHLDQSSISGTESEIIAMGHNVFVSSFEKIHRPYQYWDRKLPSVDFVVDNVNYHIHGIAHALSGNCANFIKQIQEKARSFESSNSNYCFEQFFEDKKAFSLNASKSMHDSDIMFNYTSRKQIKSLFFRLLTYHVFGKYTDLIDEKLEKHTPKYYFEVNAFKKRPNITNMPSVVNLLQTIDCLSVPIMLKEIELYTNEKDRSYVGNIRIFRSKIQADMMSLSAKLGNYEHYHSINGAGHDKYIQFFLTNPNYCTSLIPEEYQTSSRNAHKIVTNLKILEKNMTSRNARIIEESKSLTPLLMLMPDNRINSKEIKNIKNYLINYNAS